MKSMRVARVDLTKNTVKISEIPKEWERLYIGGKGIATKLLFEIPAGVDPFHPENAIVFGIGPISGLNLPGASKMTCVFKSPLTNGYGESQCGGYIAREFRRAGIDFLFVVGRAKRPVYIVVEDDDIEIRDASHLWGKDAFETEEILKRDHRGEVLSIGQAGENLVRFACITHRKGRQFGRCGAGAVMGSKKLKAIVVKGSKDVEVFDSNRFREFRGELIENAKEKLASMSKYGTPGMLTITNEAGVLPTRYWSKGSFEHCEEISAEVISKYVKRRTACYGCTVACGFVIEIDGVEVEGPEYETLYALGSLCEVRDLKYIAKASELCDRYGLDTITTGNVIAFLMECCERGEVKEDIRFGEGEKIVEFVNKIAFREGIGDVLAEGVKRASEILGVSVEPVHVKGLEPAGYDPRGLYGMALAYVTSQRGACHMRSCIYRPNLFGTVDRFSLNQAPFVKDLEDFYCVVDSLVMCRFLCLPVVGLYWNEIAELYKIVTGVEVSVDELKRIGERIFMLTLEFNKREGVRDYKLPKTFFKPIKVHGKEYVVKEDDLNRMLEEYFRLRGIDLNELR